MLSSSERREERAYELKVRRELTRNYLAHLGHGLLGQTGFRLVNAPTFMPAFILLLSGGSSFAVGLCLSLQALGMVLSPLFGAHLIEHRKRVLPVGFVAGIGMRTMVLCISLAGLFLPHAQALWLLYLCLFLLGLTMGMQGVVFNFLMSKVIPVSKRGRLTGMRNFLAGVTASVVAWIAGAYLVGNTPSATGYAYTFLLAFVLTSVGLLLLLFIREPEPPKLRPASSLFNRLGDIPALLRTDPAFTRYIIVRSVATLGRMAVPFYIIYAGADIGITGTTLGLLTFTFTLSSTISNLLWGVIADRYGFRMVFLNSLILWIGATLALMAFSGLWPIAVTFGVIGVAFQGFQNASNNMTLEFGERRDLPMRIALANTAAELTGAIGPVLGGLLATQVSYEAVFWVSAGFLAFSTIILLRFVPEPRQKKQAS